MKWICQMFYLMCVWWCLYMCVRSFMLFDLWCNPICQGNFSDKILWISEDFRDPHTHKRTVIRAAHYNWLQMVARLSERCADCGHTHIHTHTEYLCIRKVMMVSIIMLSLSTVCVSVWVLMRALECSATLGLWCYLDLKRKKKKTFGTLILKRPN